MALTKPEAAAALGISVDSFERHVQPELRVAPAGGGDRSLLRIVCEFL